MIEAALAAAALGMLYKKGIINPQNLIRPEQPMNPTVVPVPVKRDTRSDREREYSRQIKELRNQVGDTVGNAYPEYREWKFLSQDMTQVFGTESAIKTVVIKPRSGDPEKRRVRIKKDRENFLVTFFDSPDGVVTGIQPEVKPVQETVTVPEVSEEDEDIFDIDKWFRENEAVLKALTPPGTREAILPINKLPKSEAHRQILERDFFVLGYENAELIPEGLKFERA